MLRDDPRPANVPNRVLLDMSQDNDSDGGDISPERQENSVQ